jgi:hypothetical protein
MIDLTRRALPAALLTLIAATSLGSPTPASAVETVRVLVSKYDYERILACRKNGGSLEYCTKMVTSTPSR